MTKLNFNLVFITIVVSVMVYLDVIPAGKIGEWITTLLVNFKW